MQASQPPNPEITSESNAPPRGSYLQAWPGASRALRALLAAGAGHGSPHALPRAGELLQLDQHLHRPPELLVMPLPPGCRPVDCCAALVAVWRGGRDGAPDIYVCIAWRHGQPFLHSLEMAQHNATTGVRCHRPLTGASPAAFQAAPKLAEAAVTHSSISDIAISCTAISACCNAFLPGVSSGGTAT